MLPSSPRLNPPFDGGRTAPLAGLAHSPMNIGPYIVPLAMLAIAFMLMRLRCGCRPPPQGGGLEL